ncbi:MAG: ComEC/Rec2 family competence protein [Bacteroidales bacterium]|nr:ComEC/Rec2 family competence protein [Bacteroidales bacterium]
MKKGCGITYLSFPFAAGVAAAELSGAPPGAAPPACLASAIMLVFCALHQGNDRLPLAVTFIFLGAFCRCTEAIAGAPRNISLFPAALDSLCGAIDAAGFPGKNSGAIITALLTGRRGALPRSTVEAFRRSGASHILALSGLHLGIIYLFICRLLIPLGNTPAGRFFRSCIAVSLCGFYTVTTGASPSTVRAFLFIVVNEAGRSLSGRIRSPAGTFSTALMIQLAVRPSLIASAGFQLSYLAMLGIILLYPGLSTWYPGRRGLLKGIWNAAALSSSCQLFTAPAAWWHFRSLPRYYLITNLLALPMTECIIVTALVCLILQATGICPAWLVAACGKLVELMEFCLETIASL